ncbi:MAG: hypothetical protein HYV95_17765 [Opitutae bacterium]|nr:hypothetical protein [Opitutae bacterium]
MRRLLFPILLLLAVATGARAGVPALLQEALTAYGREFEHWACTVTTIVRDRDGKIDEQTVVRYDPSLPYDEQWTLLTKNGRPATERQVKKHRREMADQRKDRKTLGELLELEKAVVAEENESTVTYTVPLSPVDNTRLPPENFGVAIRVNKRTRGFEAIEVRLLKPMRVALVAKVKDAGADLKFSSVDPAHAPIVTAIRAAGTGSFMFVGLSASYEQARTDFKRVTPYSDRFQVKIGPLKVIDF